MESVLSRVNQIDVFTEPFPHLIIKDPIDEQICLQLIEDFPHLEIVTEGKAYSSNERFSYSARNVLEDERITPLWQEFVRTHTSQEFLEQITGIFAEQICNIFPDFEKEIGKINHLKAGTRRINSFKDSDVLLDAQICVNTPVLETPSSVRGPHVDNSNKLFAALYYMRDPRDTDSQGGNLEIYRYRNNKYRVFDRQFINSEDVELVKTVNYERNVLVFLLNCEQALHGVTVRQVTDHARYFFNLLGEVKQPLFELTGKVQDKTAANKWFNLPLPNPWKTWKDKLTSVR